MSEELLKSLIIWAPTLLMVLSLLFYFLVGIIRGFRKSVILLIHAAVSIGICATIFFLIVKSENIDATMVNIANYILGFFNMSVQGLLGVSEELGTIKDIILDFVLNNMSNEEVFYYVVVDAGAYISTLVEMIYRIVLFIILFVFHIFMMGFLHFIYTIFYPVRRRARRINKAYERGEVAQPYQKRRLAGGFVGVGRGLIVNVFMLSFLGCLLFVITGENDPLPSRNDGTSEEISFGDETIDMIYDYYSVVCEMSDTGIFAALNAIKDSEDKPYYFYICDLMLQGGINDEVLEISDTFYLREELGTYIGFCKDAISLLIEHAGADTNVLLSGDQEAMLEVMTNIIKDEAFVADFSELIDDFEKQPYIINLALCALTSMVNHIELIFGEDNVVTRLVKNVFNEETGLKITDLATEQDIKHLFKAVVNVASTALKDMEENPKAKQNFVNAAEEQAFDVKLIMKYANLLIDNIQALSIFGERSEVGNNLLKNVYEFCVEEFVSGEFDLPEVAATKWIDELNILFDAIEPVLNIAVEVYSDNSEELMNNLLDMFNPEKENAEFVEQQYDILVGQLTKSNILDLVIKIVLPGEKIDELLQGITNNPEACMPHSFSLASNNGQQGELEIVLSVLKDFLKNDGIQIIELLGEEITEESLTKLFDLLSVDIDPSEEVERKLIDTLLTSKVFRYFISSFITYSNLGVELYIPESASDIIIETVKVTDENGNQTEVTRKHNIIKTDELCVLTDFILSSPEFIFDLMNQSQDIDYVELLTSSEITDLLKESSLLQGIIASVIISATKEMDMIVLPYTYDNPDTWVKYKEIDSLIDAILTLKNEETESGESLFNQLMGGSFDINTILNLSQETIDSVYKSQVLKYTVSNLLTNLGSEGFAIVVPGVSCEKPNASTTNPEKKVNVISSKEILTIFEQIKNIIEFDDNNNVTILYSKMFNNKAEILSSYTIQATVMNMLINMTGQDDSIISIPKNYKDAYNSFVTTSSIDGLKNNPWFGETIEDCELYLLFEGIESLVSDEYKDENGNILDTFSLDKIATDIQIDHGTIDIVSTSGILNSTLSNVITTNLATPISVYHNDQIDRTELEALLDCLFKLLNKEKITFDDFSTLDINSIEISKDDINNVYKKSQIFMTVFSNLIMDVENISLPKKATKEIQIMKMKDKNSVYRIIDDSLLEEGKINEFDNLIDCLFMFFGSKKDGKEVLNVNTINVDGLKLDESKIDKISSSTIFTATISTIISTTELIIPIEEAEYIEMAKGGREYILSNSELNSILKTFLEMFGTDGTNGKELDVNNINLSNFIIDKDVRDKIVESPVIRATVSNYLIKEDMGIIIPKIDKTIVDIQVVGNAKTHQSITKDELAAFLDAAIELFGTENDGKKELNINNIEVSNFKINEDTIKVICDTDENNQDPKPSNIINSTITCELAKIEELVIPFRRDNDDLVTLTLNATNNSSCALINNMERFLDDMLTMLGTENEEGQKELDTNNLSAMNIKLDKKNKLDPILEASIGNVLLENDDILIPVNSVSDIEVLAYLNGEVTKRSKKSIDSKEFEAFKNSLIEVLGENGELNINLDSGIDVGKMVLYKDNVIKNPNSPDEYLLDSTIFFATVTEAISKISALTIPSVVKVNKQFYDKPSHRTITDDEINQFFVSIFEVVGDAEEKNPSIDIQSFDMSKISLPKDKNGAESLFKSLIMSATVSNIVLNQTGDSFVKIDQVLTDYNNNNSSEKYITQKELSNLILALTIGLGKTNADNLEIQNVSIPESETQMKALLGSTLIRATISKEVMNQQTEGVEIAVAVDVCDNYTVGGKKVASINQTELENLIKGLKEITTDNFSNISIRLEDILEAQDGLNIETIATSLILRSLLTDKATKKHTILTKEFFTYELVRTSEDSIEFPNGEIYYYQEHLIDFGIGKYTIQAPSQTVEIYKEFEITTTSTKVLFTIDDILALKGMDMASLPGM